MADVEEKLREYERYMPPMSQPMAQALEAIRAPQADARALSRLVMRDTILASKTFKLVNSSYFGASGSQLASINKALMSLGAMKVKNIIIALVLQKFYEDDGPQFLFCHSIETATAAEFLALEYKTINPDDAFILGFLHDVGMIIFKQRYGKDYEDLIAESKGDFDLLCELERNAYGLDHCDIGAKLCTHWNLPKILVDTIKYHHSVKTATIPFAAGIIYLADKIIAKKTESVVINQEILEYLGVALGDTTQLREKIIAKTQIFMKELSDF